MAATESDCALGSALELVLTVEGLAQQNARVVTFLADIADMTLGTASFQENMGALDHAKNSVATDLAPHNLY